MDKKYSIAVDFDGVCHQYTSAWAGAMVINDPPMPGVIEWLKEMSESFNIIIHTCRLKQHNGPEHLDEVFAPQTPDVVKAVRAAIKLWFLQHGLPEEVLDGFIFWVKPGKPTALVYIDDRGYRFEGAFPTKDDIHQKLRPWKYKATEAQSKLATSTREELQSYLEGRGFAVYDHEDIDDLRTAAMLDQEEEEEENRCDHQPDEHTFSYSGSDLIIDVNCRVCGMSGSFAVSPGDINWE